MLRKADCHSGAALDPAALGPAVLTDPAYLMYSGQLHK